MSSTPTITLYNELDRQIDPVTCVIAERARAANPVRLTVGHGASVMHEVAEGSGPWEVSIHVGDNRSSGRGSVTATSTFSELPADLRLETDHGTVRFDFRGGPSDPGSGPDPRRKGAQSVLNLESSWAQVAEPPAAEVGSELSFLMEQQRYSQWCWAAVTASVAGFYGQGEVTQCRLAQWRFGSRTADCCSSPLPPACNNPSSTRQALEHVGNLDSWTETGIPFSQVKQEIDAGRPIALAVKWDSTGSRHAVAITGYSEGETDRITVQDPGRGTTSAIPYLAFPVDYQGGATWAATFITKQN